MSQNNQPNENEKGSFSKIEEDVLDFWKKNDIFQKSVQKEAPQGDYVFYDGPPFITGLPHYATLLPSIAKDVIPRYFTMNGYRVQRVWGWDCHGLPAENKVEEKLQLKNKKDIEELGVDKFINACFDYVNTGCDQWRWYIDRIGRWVDMDNAYKTMDKEFMESVIWAFKELYDKNLIYEGYRTSLHCPRCATPLSKFEITMDAGSYRDIEEEAIIVRFKAENGMYLLAWTTTPWTIPGNLALAIGKNVEYKIVEHNNEQYILSAKSIEQVFANKEYKVIGNIEEKDIAGIKYKPVFNLNNKDIQKSSNVFKVYVADFVNTEEGTGIVHIAPNFGEDDFMLGEKVGIPIVDLMDESGVYTINAGEWNGLYFKKAGKKVLQDLGDKLFLQYMHTHSYPFCYRCKTSLIHKTQKAWYLKISDIRQKMIDNNKDINWIPEHFKQGRFNYNLQNAPDWCLSRSRYFGSPVPVWKCSCQNIKVIGSIKELEKLSGTKVTDLHRPFIDKIIISCDKCGGEMKRVVEVLDCWFESGSMPFGQFHYPFEKKEEWKNLFPADFIIEYTGQLRGWFYYLHVLSTSLFNDKAFKNVIVTGVLAGNDGRKMSKSLGNYPDPKMVLDKYGSDALRIYFMSNPIMVGGDTNLTEEDIKNALRKNIMLLVNVLSFYEIFTVQENKLFTEEDLSNNPQSPHILDKWIVSSLHKTISEIDHNLKNYTMPPACHAISSFIDDLSVWYIRRSRNRFKGEDKKDALFAIQTTGYVLHNFCKAIAPITPFLAEHIWQRITGNNFSNKDKSVHLTNYPVFDNKAIDKKLLLEMEKTREIVSLALSQRSEAGIKVRQPLSALKITSTYADSINRKEEMFTLIKEEVNIKEIIVDQKIQEGVELDTKITSHLKEEGVVREIIRAIQNLRKETGLAPKDKINLSYDGEDFGDIFCNWEEYLQKEIGAEKITQEKLNKEDKVKEIKIEEKILLLKIKKDK